MLAGLSAHALFVDLQLKAAARCACRLTASCSRRRFARSCKCLAPLCRSKQMTALVSPRQRAASLPRLISRALSVLLALSLSSSRRKRALPSQSSRPSGHPSRSATMCCESSRLARRRRFPRRSTSKATRSRSSASPSRSTTANAAATSPRAARASSPMTRTRCVFASIRCFRGFDCSRGRAPTSSAATSTRLRTPPANRACSSDTLTSPLLLANRPPGRAK